MQIRNADAADYGTVASVIDDWWGGRTIAPLFHPFFFEHFRETCYIAEDGEGLAAFLCGFLSQSFLEQAYIHLVAVRPELRGVGIGRGLYGKFFDDVRAAGRTTIRAVTSPENTGSIAFHQRMDFHPRFGQQGRIEFFRRL
jgi:ribosomal protein S18 acetylase RimI-like enzyme